MPLARARYRLQRTVLCLKRSCRRLHNACRCAHSFTPLCTRSATGDGRGFVAAAVILFLVLLFVVVSVLVFLLVLVFIAPPNPCRPPPSSSRSMSPSYSLSSSYATRRRLRQNCRRRTCTMIADFLLSFNTTIGFRWSEKKPPAA